jgi:uncharacterized protein (DUF2236 family)
MQNMHPAAGRRGRGALDLLPGALAAVAAFAVSDRRCGVRQRPGPADRRGGRDYHVDIKGVDAQGRRYHALNPDVFYWAHSTFFVGTIIVADRLCGGITEDEKRQLFEEHVQWYSMYGMSMRPVPKTWEDSRVLAAHVHRGAGEQQGRPRCAGSARAAQAPFVEWMPEWMWRANRAVISPFFVWFTVGLYDPSVRKLMGYSWSQPRRVAAPPVRRGGEPGVPGPAQRSRMHPRARAGWDRATGRIAVDAPPGDAGAQSPAGRAS